MIGRRQWLKGTMAPGLAAWAVGGAGGFVRVALGQTGPAPKGSTTRRTVRRPAMNSTKDTGRTVPDPRALPLRPSDALNRLLEPIRGGHHLPGMIGAVLTGDGLTAIGAVGLRKIGSSEPMQVTDQVHIGSCTKTMTATLIGMLVDDGLLSWSSTVRDIFPELASRLHPDFQTVTLSHLLTHRAGLPHDAPWWSLSGRTTTEKRRAALRTLMAEPPLSKPGTQYSYSNAGYALAGLMAEQVTGQPWEDQLQHRLFEPLGMASAGFGPPGGFGSRGVDQPWGHRERGGTVESVRQDNSPCMGPAGTVHCSVPDWAKFAALHLRAEQGKPRLLKASTFKTLHTPPSGLEYAGGWLVFDRSWAGGKALNHSGSNTMWYATIWLAPARNFGTLIATNQGGDAASAACEQASQELIKFAEYSPAGRYSRR